MSLGDLCSNSSSNLISVWDFSFCLVILGDVFHVFSPRPMTVITFLPDVLSEKKKNVFLQILTKILPLVCIWLKIQS